VDGAGYPARSWDVGFGDNHLTILREMSSWGLSAVYDKLWTVTLAPAISRFVTSTQAKAGIGAEMDQQAKDVWRELANLHQRWGKVSKITEGDNIRAQACNDANASLLFTRIVQRKNLP
jgi:hypothetical protein